MPVFLGESHWFGDHACAPRAVFPKSTRLGLALRGQASALRAFFDRGGIIYEAHGAKVRVRYAHANLHASIEAGEPLSARINLLLGESARDWRQDIPTYQVLRYRDLYTGIDLKYGGEGDGIKSEFIVRPGADPEQIRLTYDNAEHISVDGQGNLIVRVQGAEWRDDAPVIFRLSGQARVAVKGRYSLLDANTVGFEIDGLNPALP